MGKKIDGKQIALQIRKEVQQKNEAFVAKYEMQPCLAVILVGNHPASLSYVQSKVKACKEVGMESRLIQLDAEVSEADLLKEIEKLNQDAYVDGILVQLPLPQHIHEDTVVYAIDPNKDVDGFHPINIGKMMLGVDTFYPCTPHGVIKMLEAISYDLCGKNVVVIGRSMIVGKPMAQLCLEQNATVTACHSKTKDLTFYTKHADVIIVAVGKPLFLTEDQVSPGAVVIDVGINRNAKGKLVGDVDTESVLKVADYVTPVPGGVGPMTITMLLWNTIIAAERRVLAGTKNNHCFLG